ncbi:hypothetical protein ACFYO2_39180 [Streptomyces sp. NPDC006602]|uniref:hypothetical protein n=1 Tax=Streptomyces sp. NPDC006602 TaxID=3364751 RepID=UPI0036B67AAE
MLREKAGKPPYREMAAKACYSAPARRVGVPLARGGRGGPGALGRGAGADLAENTSLLARPGTARRERAGALMSFVQAVAEAARSDPVFENIRDDNNDHGKCSQTHRSGDRSTPGSGAGPGRT